MRASKTGLNCMVTGSSGFIGTHLCGELPHATGIDRKEPSSAVAYRHITADIRCPDRLRDVRDSVGSPEVVFHLAAGAEVLTPWSELPPLLSSNVEGTYNVLECLAPRLVIFPSSSSVYGSAGLHPVAPRSAVQPLCLYAISKVTGEMILRDWVRETRNSAVIFRIGNVVGPGCAGLVRFLIRHVLRHPHGDTPARLRGGGLLVRDYVPVEHVVRAFLTAARTDWPAETRLTLNLSSGRAMTNREIAEIVEEATNELGFPLHFTFDDPPGPGEADQVVLDPEDTTKALGLAPPTPAEIKRAIADAVVESLGREASVEKDPV